MVATEKEWHQLLLSLKVTVEGLLANQVPNVWNVYGGLNRLNSVVEKLFRHGYKVNNKEGVPDYWLFIKGLSWLQPALSICLLPEAANGLPPCIRDNKALLWIHHNLEQHSLSEKLHWLVSDRSHLLSCFSEMAFFCQPRYAEAAITCLKAVEQNRPALLVDVDPALYVMDLNYVRFKRHHRRCASLPDPKARMIERPVRGKDVEMPVFSSSVDSHKDLGHVVTGINVVHGSIPRAAEQAKCVAKRSRSLPDLSDPTQASFRIRSKTVTTKLSPSVLRVDYKEVAKKPLKKEKPAAKPRPRRRRDEDGWFVVQGKKEERKKTFMEDGGTSVLPMATGFFPRPAQGQSLTSFLSSEQFSRASAELDRENAHFSISEAMIAAIEQMKCNRQWQLVEEAGDESDEEINSLKQRIRLRRRQRQQERQLKAKHTWCAGLLSDGRTDTTTTDQSVSPCSTSPETPSDSISTDDVEELDLEGSSEPKLSRGSGLSVSMASLYSDADVSRGGARLGAEPSAEVVALSLLRQFKEKQLPRASELEWLVSEQEAPQELLPLPRSWPVSPDEAETEDMRLATPLRGTAEWAPPRAQVIFTQHSPPKRKVVIARQNSRCAGCGLRVSQEYAHRFRYCEYLGRYFCTGCHSNQLSVIPGRILSSWNFNRYPVSSFSYRLLDQMATDPLFQINDLNPGLYKKVKQLERTRQWRLQLYYLKDFLFSCRFAQTLREEFEREQSYILTNPDMFSLQDLIQTKAGELPARMRDLVRDGQTHVNTCELCQARGFVCELCPSKEVIFPWHVNKVSRCGKCGACYHGACFKSGFCPRCTRVDARRRSRVENDF